MYHRGRRKIFSINEEITAENVWNTVQDALQIHSNNAHDIDYLYGYYKGDQPILYREKEIRPEINNKIVVNRAYEIVSYKRGYLLTNAIQYIRADGNNDASKDIDYLNDCMKSEGKTTKDSVLAEWLYICGTGYRIVMPKKWVGKRGASSPAESPFELYTLDPREVFVAHSRKVGNKPLFACIQATPVDVSNDKNEYTVYTDNAIYTCIDGKVTVDPNPLGMIPVIEYPENFSRLGSFEIVLEILDAINTAASNRLDDIEQTVQSLLVLFGVDIEIKDSEGNSVNTIDAMRKQGGIALPEGTDAKYLSSPLNQGSVKSLLEDYEKQWIEICGMPNRNGGGSTSDTGNAVYMRDGFSDAESRAASTEAMWKQSEKDFLKVVLKIISQVKDVSLTADDIEAHFNRQNAVNLQSKTQSFCELMNNGWTDLRDALKFSGIAYDVESAYENGMKWHEEQEAKQAEQLQMAVQQEEKVNHDEE